MTALKNVNVKNLNKTEELFLWLSTMDKLTIISGTLFMAADIFAIVSLAMPDWIITDVGGWLIYLFWCNLD